MINGSIVASVHREKVIVVEGKFCTHTHTYSVRIQNVLRASFIRTNSHDMLTSDMFDLCKCIEILCAKIVVLYTRELISCFFLIRSRAPFLCLCLCFYSVFTLV